MQNRQSDLITPTPDDFIDEVLHSTAFAGAHPFTYVDAHGQECQLLLFALKCPVSMRKLIDMMHVLVQTVDFYECWKDGRRPSDAEIAAESPER